MKTKLIDTNILIRFLVEDKTNSNYSKVFDLFEKLENKEDSVFVDSVVIIEAFYVLTKVYKATIAETVQSLKAVLAFSGIEMKDKTLVLSALDRLTKKKMDFADAYLIELSLSKGLSIYTFDEDIIKSEAQTCSLID